MRCWSCDAARRTFEPCPATPMSALTTTRHLSQRLEHRATTARRCDETAVRDNWNGGAARKTWRNVAASPVRELQSSHRSARRMRQSLEKTARGSRTSRAIRLWARTAVQRSRRGRQSSRRLRRMCVAHRRSVGTGRRLRRHIWKSLGAAGMRLRATRRLGRTAA
jgi:hypothetical protein